MRPSREAAAAQESGAPPVEPTEYAKNRPRRDTAVVSSGACFRDAGGGNLDLHPLRHFAPSAPGGGGAGAQPFDMTCSPSALLLMDLHAHLGSNEAIGYLGRVPRCNELNPALCFASYIEALSKYDEPLSFILCFR